ncbi:ubiquitin-like modifier-activating enzyme ATG7 [Styela clava]
MSENASKKLQFVPFSSTVSPGFWYQLVDKKLNVFKLNDSAQEINGFYMNSDSGGVSCRHTVEYDSFEPLGTTPSLCQASHGRLYNKNTVEEFKEVDKKELLENEADLIWNDIKSGRAIQEPSLLVRFCLLSFADLKKYHFYYWFGFPTFLHATDHLQVEKCCPITDEISENNIAVLNDAIKKFKGRKSFYLIASENENFKNPCCHDLCEFSSLANQSKEICFVCFDPSTAAGHPGWPLRNFLLLVSMHWMKELNGNIKVICLRETIQEGVKTISNSLFLHLTYDLTTTSDLFTNQLTAIGWERNRNNKLGPRHVNLAETMDPTKLAESAVGLNLKLMRWRLMPTIDLEKIAKSKCLLLGAGTLGCNVARALLGWGVKKITLIDYGRVSFSNPVRQSLFEFSDCSTSGGRPKAIAAAEKLVQIFPGVDATGMELSIPMPGHPVNTNEKTLKKAREDVSTLTQLIESHDAVFLLMDSRESRWLPTVLASAKRKLVINAALGFDSYLVMRHGVESKSEDQQKLGCYFCNDVVAPGNSIKDRTLDQQCTVSRPGISMIASALAVELFVSVLQHSEGSQYLSNKTEDEVNDNKDDFPLGLIPHQIRGFISHYQTILPTTHSFSKCTACSKIVLDKYGEGEIDFLMEVFNSPPQYLEDITGLTELHKETALAEDEILEFSDGESI